MALLRVTSNVGQRHFILRAVAEPLGLRGWIPGVHGRVNDGRQLGPSAPERPRKGAAVVGVGRMSTAPAWLGVVVVRGWI